MWVNLLIVMLEYTTPKYLAVQFDDFDRLFAFGMRALNDVIFHFILVIRSMVKTQR